MNILFFLHSFSVGGAERRCAMIANSLASQGHNVVAVLLDAPNICFDVDERVKIFYLPDTENEILLRNNYSYKSPQMSIINPENKEKLKSKDSLSTEAIDDIVALYSNRILNFLKKYPDYIVVSWVSLYSISCAIALENLPNKFVFVECNSPQAEFPKEHYFNLLKKKWYSRAQLAIFQTDEEKDFYDFLTDTKKVVIPNPVTDFGVKRFEGERKRIIVTFSRLKKVKRIPMLIDAFSLLKNDFPDYKMHIFGEGPEREYILEYIRKKELDDSVSLFDFDLNVHKRVYDYAMYVSASEYEGMSNSMLEALSIGLPTICTDCFGGGARAVIENGINGILVQRDDLNGLYLAMRKIAADRDYSDKLSKNAVKVKDALSKDVICSKWADVFRSII